MREVRPCAVCGKMTAKFLFKDRMLGISICSTKCEYEYFHNLAPDMKEQMNIMRYLDEKIEESKERDKILWVMSGFGLVPIVVGILLANAVLFIVGSAVVSIGTLLTRHFEDKINKLMRMRKRIVI